jgi:hypothetical protein
MRAREAMRAGHSYLYYNPVETYVKTHPEVSVEEFFGILNKSL